MFEVGDIVWADGEGYETFCGVVTESIGEQRSQEDECFYIVTNEEEAKEVVESEYNIWSDLHYKMSHWPYFARKERQFEDGEKVRFIAKDRNLFSPHQWDEISPFDGKIVTIEGIGSINESDTSWGYSFKETDDYIVCHPKMFKALTSEKERGAAQPGLPSI